MALYMGERRKSRRDKLIAMSGGKCTRCCSTDDLNFDHKNPAERKFRLTGKALDGPWEKILEEWRKCQLLCRACHLLKTKENGEYGEPVNKGISKWGEVLPEHGCEPAYAHGCRCDKCRNAKHEARIRRGEITGIRGKTCGAPKARPGEIRHGTRSGYQAELRQGLIACEECRKANAEETRRRKQNKKLLACGEKASFSAVTGALSVRVGLGQPDHESSF